jgi:hypothetical protein
VEIPVGETTVLLAVLIVIRVLLVVTVMIAHRVVSIVMLRVPHLVVIAMTDRVRLIVTLVRHAALIVIRVSRVMIVRAGLIVIHVLRAVQRKNVQMKLKAVLANVAQVAKCQHHQSVLVKIG